MLVGREAGVLSTVYSVVGQEGLEGFGRTEKYECKLRVQQTPIDITTCTRFTSTALSA
jgi:hypothetical protein